MGRNWRKIAERWGLLVGSQSAHTLSKSTVTVSAGAFASRRNAPCFSIIGKTIGYPVYRLRFGLSYTTMSMQTRDPENVATRFQC
jgi:hypothetical protein